MSAQDADDERERLKALYCPPIDDATFLAITSDFDLSVAAQLAEATNILDMLAESANVEEATGFDPSGSGAGAVGDVGEASPSLGPGLNDSTSQSEGRSNEWSSGRDTDETSLGQGMSALDLEGVEFDSERASSNGTELQDGDNANVGTSLAQNHNSELAGLSLEEKEAVLIETFPGLKPFDINWTLKKCRGDAGAAIEELLNQVFLEETGRRHRSVEAFAADDEVAGSGKQKKGKGKGRKKRSPLSEAGREDSNLTSEGSGSYDARATGNAELIDGKWDLARQDVEFITKHTGLSSKQVSSLYHDKGGSLHKTINSIIDMQLRMQADEDVGRYDGEAAKLNDEFPGIPVERLVGLIQISVSEEAQYEMARALATPPRRAATSGKPSTPIQLSFTYTKPDLGDAVPTSPKPRSHNAVYVNESDEPRHLPAYANDGRDYASLRNSAFNQASTAYRKSKSDHLMGGAAAYYASLGRDYHTRHKAISSIQADAIVSRQSSPQQLDLHGIGVADAVRIAREKVTAWWVSMGHRVGGYGGFRIVTGKGTHSEGGIARVGPAVGRMLIREGWRVEVGSGWLTVTGVVGKGRAGRR